MKGMDITIRARKLVYELLELMPSTHQKASLKALLVLFLGTRGLALPEHANEKVPVRHKPLSKPLRVAYHQRHRHPPNRAPFGVATTPQNWPQAHPESHSRSDASAEEWLLQGADGADTRPEQKAGRAVGGVVPGAGRLAGSVGLSCLARQGQRLAWGTGSKAPAYSAKDAHRPLPGDGVG
jgi:hypothetical protein